MPINFEEYTRMEAAQKNLYQNEIGGYDSAVKLVGEKVATAILISVLKKIAAEKYFPKVDGETASAKESREELITNFVRTVLQTNKIIGKEQTS